MIHKILFGVLGAMASGYALNAQAHSAAGIFDPNGDNPHATVYADISCFDDGNGPAAVLFARIRDLSPPVVGLLVNLQLQKGVLATNTTDTASGDATFSPAVELPGGDGVYRLLINKTAAGARNVELEYHCLTAAHAHTGTEATARQVQ